MCGIVGIAQFDGPSHEISHERSGPESSGIDILGQLDESLLRQMLRMIHHRGPDAFGLYLDNYVGLGSARLSIIDLEGGNQPVHNENQKVWVVYNGEVFNYPELRADLQARGHRFYTQSDTEVLVHLYEDHGPALLDKLNGQFAFAIWDLERQTLLLARDRLGIRPLFYSENQGRLTFGSEVKALFADPRIPRAISPSVLSEIFTFWAPLGANTPFEGVRQLLPGHYALFDRGGLKIRSYWRPTFSNPFPASRTLEDLIEELTALLHDATRIRLRADVPVGAYLSGGLDSTYTSALVKRDFNNRLCTFSVSFEDRRFDESPFQAQAVDALKTDHRSIQCSEADIGTLFPEVIWHAESPILRTAPAPLFKLSKLVRENGYKVVLTGEGADEIFAGYNIFKEDRIRRFWARQPNSKIRPLLLRKLYPYVFPEEKLSARAFLEVFFKRQLANTDSPVYSHMIRWENTHSLTNFFAQDVAASSPGKQELIEKYATSLPDEFSSWDPLSKAQYTEISIFLSNYLLSSQGDRVAMGNSVEGRFPFLDYRVVEFACSIPSKYRLNGLTEKYILRQAAKGIVPEQLLKRPKHPYRAPNSQCFIGPRCLDYVEQLLSGLAIKRAGYFNPIRVSRLVEKARKNDGHLLSERENMALVGILSTQLVDKFFIREFSQAVGNEPKVVQVVNHKTNCPGTGHVVDMNRRQAR